MIDLFVKCYQDFIKIMKKDEYRNLSIIGLWETFIIIGYPSNSEFWSIYALKMAFIVNKEINKLIPCGNYKITLNDLFG